MLVIMQDKGEYVGFDTAEFTSRSGGKPAAIKAIKVHAKQKTLLYSRLCQSDIYFTEILSVVG